MEPANDERTLYTVSVVPANMQAAYTEAITKDPDTKKIQIRYAVYTSSQGAAGSQDAQVGDSFIGPFDITLKPYDPAHVIEPAYYLVGAPEGWAGPNPGSEAHYADWCLFEDADKIDSKIYKGTFDIAAGQAQFRFYTKLDGWDGSSWGSQVNDSPIDYELVGGSFAGKLVAGKGSLNFPGWTGGKMNITVDMSDMTNVTITIKAE